MRKILLVIFIVAASTITAQKKDIRLNVGFQVGLPERFFNPEISRFNDKNAGGGIHWMLIWNYDRNWTYGLNLEFNFVQENFVTDAITAYDVYSVLPTVNYRFTHWKVHPFVGMGAGVYGIFYAGGLNFGIRPIVGFSFWEVFNLSAEYSKFFGSTSIPDESDFGNYYFAIKASFSIGLARSRRMKNAKNYQF